MSGLVGDSFTFVGFPPNRSQDRKKWLERLASGLRPLVMFEAPHRIRATLADMLEVLGDRDVAICREITKIHEELVKGHISAVRARLKSPRGEFTIVVSPQPDIEIPAERPDIVQLWSEFCHLTNSGTVSRRAAINSLAKRHGLSSRTVYRAIEKSQLIGLWTY